MRRRDFIALLGAAAIARPLAARAQPQAPLARIRDIDQRGKPEKPALRGVQQENGRARLYRGSNPPD